MHIQNKHVLKSPHSNVSWNMKNPNELSYSMSFAKQNLMKTWFRMEMNIANSMEELLWLCQPNEL